MSQWNNSQYDAGNSAFGGKAGGFNASQSPMSTPATGGKPNADRYLLPATIRMLKEAEESGDGTARVVNGRKLTSVKIVGRIQAVDTKATYTSYLIDDSTGVIDVKQWSNNGEEAAATFGENEYVSVWGKVTVFQSNTQLNSYSIRKVENFNEITHHMVSVCHAHLSNKKNATATSSIGATNSGVTSIGMGATTNNAGSMGGDDQEWTDCQTKVYNAVSHLQKSSGSQGVHINNLVENVKGFSASDIREAVTFLINEGQVYDTVSEEWIRTTNDA